MKIPSRCKFSSSLVWYPILTDPLSFCSMLFNIYLMNAITTATTYLSHADSSLLQPPVSFADYRATFGLAGFTSHKFAINTFSMLQISLQKQQDPSSSVDRFGGGNGIHEIYIKQH